MTMPISNADPVVRIKAETRDRLMKLALELSAERGRRVPMSDAIDELFARDDARKADR